MIEKYPDRIGLISLEETAYLMRIAASTVRKWRRIGRIPSECVVRVSPRKYMYVEQEIIKLMNAGFVYDAQAWKRLQDSKNSTVEFQYSAPI